MSDSPWLSRRTFLGTAAAVGAGTLVAGGKRLVSGRDGTTLEGPLNADVPPQLPRRRLGRTGASIPILLVGGGGHHAVAREPKYHEASLFGATYFDTADCYRDCERALGGFVAEHGRRDDLWITTKSCPDDAAGMEASLTQSLQRLGTDHVDLFMLHALEDVGPLEDVAVRDLVARLKAEGRIRHFGFSTHSAQVPTLLEAAARTPWVDAVMFRYNFRVYGDARLNAAMDAAHSAGVGLIAMKTQASALTAVSDWAPFTGSGTWSRYQAVLKAVWADPRITAAASLMDTTAKLRQNLAAALGEAPLSAVDRAELQRYASSTRPYACDGCDHLCGAAIGEPIAIGAVLRHVMYAETYGREDEARRRFAALPPAHRALDGIDWGPAERACPHGVTIGRYMARAQRLWMNDEERA